MPSLRTAVIQKQKCILLHTVKSYIYKKKTKQTNIVKEAKKQHCSRCIAKSNNKITTTWNNMKKETGKVHSLEQVPTLLVNDEKLKDPTYIANAFNNFFTTIT